jgi:hypothetical protein
MGRPFEHEARLKELLAKQSQLSAALDLDKHEAQVGADAPEENARGFATRLRAEDRAAMTVQ